MKTNEKLQKLEDKLKEYGQIIIAFSGGVDSTFLLSFAYKVLGSENVAAISASGPNFAKDETDYAQAVCDRLGISYKKIDAAHVLPIIEENPIDRCYHCKKELFSLLKEYAETTGSILADGTNYDDIKDYRPGHRALAELEIASPLRDSELTKAEIRKALETICEQDSNLKAALKLTDTMTIWDKPAFACLASRIPYGEKITMEKLEKIYEAETYLRSKGFTQLRVRCHETAKGHETVKDGERSLLARIEVVPEEMNRICIPKVIAEINETLKKIGFKFVTLDMGGYKMGSLN